MYPYHNVKEDIARYKKLYQDMASERNQFKQQCTQGEDDRSC